MDTNRTSRSHAADAGERRHRLRREQSKRPRQRREYLLPDPKRRPALGSAAEEDCYQFGGAKGLSSVSP